jgi:hypothetical protein
MSPDQNLIQFSLKTKRSRSSRVSLRGKGLIACWLFIAVAVVSVGFSESIEYGLQNPYLRAHFRTQFLNGTAPHTTRRGRVYQVDLNSLERNVDRLVLHYLTELSEKIAALKRSYNQVAALRESLLLSEIDPQVRRALLRDWRERFDDLEDSADDLKDSVRLVLPWVKSKTDFKPELNVTADNPAFQTEIAFIRDQIEQAETRIRDFFFTPNHTVTVTELTDDSVLIQLFRVEKLSRQIKTSL